MGKVAFEVADVFDVQRFVADIDAYCLRHEVLVADLSRITGISPSTVSNLRTKGILSIQTAVVFAYVIDVQLDGYICTDNLERTLGGDMLKVAAMPGDRPANNDGRYSATKKARQKALKRLIAKYQDEYNAMLDEERVALGLDPLHAPVPEPVEPSEAQWVLEPELTLDDRVDWAYPGERRLADETSEALVEVVVRQIKEPAVMDYAGVTK